MKYVIDAGNDGRKLLDYLRKTLGLSRACVTSLKQKERGIELNGEHVTVRAVLRTGDVLSLETEDSADDENENVVPADIPIEILYEDNDIAAVNKPSGMPTHPSHGHYDDTLANALAYRYRGQKTPFVFRAVNRLDRDTSGIVLVARNRDAAYKMSKQMAQGGIKKTYTAIVTGEVREAGTVNANIKRRTESIITRCVCGDGEGQSAVTEYEPILVSKEMTALKIRLHTGRTHQIRVHTAYMGHPVVGDTLYGDPAGSPYISRQALHCSELSFVTPSGKTVTLNAPLFPDMEKVVSKIREDNK